MSSGMCGGRIACTRIETERIKLQFNECFKIQMIVCCAWNFNSALLNAYTLRHFHKFVPFDPTNKFVVFFFCMSSFCVMTAPDTMCLRKPFPFVCCFFFSLECFCSYAAAHSQQVIRNQQKIHFFHISILRRGKKNSS